MILLNDLSTQLNLPDSEEHRVLSNVPWTQYQHLLNELGNSPYRVCYLDGVLEIVASSRRHESSKTRAATTLARRNLGSLLCQVEDAVQL
ncbi:MAG: hypothetical protein ACFB5Z_04840 [Elainellaceae cyanobacterium]